MHTWGSGSKRPKTNAKDRLRSISGPFVCHSRLKKRMISRRNVKEALIMTSISGCAEGKGRHLSWLYKLTYVPNVGNCPAATETPVRSLCSWDDTSSRILLTSSLYVRS